MERSVGECTGKKEERRDEWIGVDADSIGGEPVCVWSARELETPE